MPKGKMGKLPKLQIVRPGREGVETMMLELTSKDPHKKPHPSCAFCLRSLHHQVKLDQLNLCLCKETIFDDANKGASPFDLCAC